MIIIIMILCDSPKIDYDCMQTKKQIFFFFSSIVVLKTQNVTYLVTRRAVCGAATYEEAESLRVRLALIVLSRLVRRVERDATDAAVKGLVGGGRRGGATGRVRFLRVAARRRRRRRRRRPFRLPLQAARSHEKLAQLNARRKRRPSLRAEGHAERGGERRVRSAGRQLAAERRRQARYRRGRHRQAGRHLQRRRQLRRQVTCATDTFVNRVQRRANVKTAEIFVEKSSRNKSKNT